MYGLFITAATTKITTPIRRQLRNIDMLDSIQTKALYLYSFNVLTVLKPKQKRDYLHYHLIYNDRCNMPPGAICPPPTRDLRPYTLHLSPSHVKHTDESSSAIPLYHCPCPACLPIRCPYVEHHARLCPSRRQDTSYLL